MKKRFIVKVQISIATSYHFPQVLVYNKDQSIMYQGDVTKDIAKRFKQEADKDDFESQFKQFWYAYIENKQIVLDEPAPYQKW